MDGARIRPQGGSPSRDQTVTLSPRTVALPQGPMAPTFILPGSVL